MVVAPAADAAVAPSGTGSATATAAGGSGTAAGSGAGSGSDVTDVAFSRHAGMCPSTVLGSTTKDELKAGKVLVTISAKDKDAIDAVQTRAAELLKEKSDNTAAGTTTSGHDHKGTHGGGMGLCPVFVPEGASAEAKNDATGVVITLTPPAATKPDEYKAIVDARITKSADWVRDNIKAGDKLNEGGTGGGSGHDGMNHSGKGDGKGAERKAAGK